MPELLVAMTSGIFIGLSLGLTGSGGSLFAIPLLVLFVGMDMNRAVPLSMLVVGVTALVGAILACRNRLLLLKPTIIFGIAGMMSVPVGLALGAKTPEHLRAFSFAVLAIVIALKMAWQSSNAPLTRIVRADVEAGSSSPVCRYAPRELVSVSFPCAFALAVLGSLVGLLSGFFGVGGGFLIVPVLMYVMRVDMPYAVGSSLAIIAMIGLTGGTLEGVAIVLDDPSALVFGVGSLVGMALGRALCRRLAGPILLRLFSVALLFTSIIMISKG